VEEEKSEIVPQRSTPRTFGESMCNQDVILHPDSHVMYERPPPLDSMVSELETKRNQRGQGLDLDDLIEPNRFDEEYRKK